MDTGRGNWGVIYFVLVLHSIEELTLHAVPLHSKFISGIEAKEKLRLCSCVFDFVVCVI